MCIRMQHINTQGTRVYMGTILDEELHPAFRRLMDEYQIYAGSVQFIGGLTQIEFRSYDLQKKIRRPPVSHCGALDVVHAYGHLSYRDDLPHVHLHAAVTVPHSGIWTTGGHVERATAFAIEFTIWAYDGAALTRSFDEATGLDLWQQPEF